MDTPPIPDIGEIINGSTITSDLIWGDPVQTWTVVNPNDVFTEGQTPRYTVATTPVSPTSTSQAPLTSTQINVIPVARDADADIDNRVQQMK